MEDRFDFPEWIPMNAVLSEKLPIDGQLGHQARRLSALDKRDIAEKPLFTSAVLHFNNTGC